MALQKTMETSSGIEVTDAYNKVELISLVAKDKMVFTVRTYKDSTKPFVFGTDYEAAFDLNGTNPLAQAYEYLKTLPEFSDAVDC